MNEPDRIEEALKNLQPAPLPGPLMARLTAARPRPAEPAEPPQPWWRVALLRWLLPVAASACVAVGTFFWLEQRRGDAVPPATVSVPVPTAVESQDYLVAARPVGILVAPDHRPYRIVEVEWLEHETVRGRGGVPDIHMATARRDVVPVALELY